jgi:RHH-type proline utilization regulon transcriptional repressor/proline dehydrogenase/delta 1-pyrroline-5-carboxylate dehydrogenase
VPDAATAPRGQAPRAFLVKSASAWALGITARASSSPARRRTGIIGSSPSASALPAVRTATRQAMRLMGNHFVLGQTIEEALKRAGPAPASSIAIPSTCSAKAHARPSRRRRYFDSYSAAIDAIGRSAGNEPLPNRPGISVKLSALHPRYEATSRERVLAELVPQGDRARAQAKAYDLNFTIDAEEADRLELSLDVIDAVMADPSLAGWDGFGLAIQAYQKRASAGDRPYRALAERMTALMVRLVKGAYWDTEMKRAQERGLPDYPVFTRKAMTDLNYVACAAQLLASAAAHLPAIRHP